MNRILSQEEIDALVSASTGQVHDDEVRPSGANDGIAPYNFRRPDRVSKEQLRSLHFLHDRFAKNLGTSMSAFLRAMTNVTMLSVEQFTYGEFLMSLPDPTAFYSVAMPPLDGVGALEVNPSIAFAMVDRMLGGTGDSPAPNRALTEIEQNVMDSVVKLLLEHLTETWRAITDVRFRIQGRETRPQMLQVTGLNEGVILLAFDIAISEARGMLSLAIPAAAIETMEEKVAEGWNRTRRQASPAEMARLQVNLGRVPLSVKTQLETRMTAREVLALRPGDIVAMPQPATAPVEIHVGGVQRYTGRLTRSPHGKTAVTLEHATGETALVPVM